MIAGAIYGTGLIALSFSRSLAMASIITLARRVSLMMQMASSNTMARLGIESLGSLFFGVIANWIGTPRTLMIGGAFSVLAVAAFAANLRSIRQASRSFDNNSKRPNREDA